jgi:hypothetical protein
VITVYFNHKGYYITGEGIDIARSCSPALDDSGNPLFDIEHHLYYVAIFALAELKDREVKEDILVYNDTRIIEELNGMASALNEYSEELALYVKRQLLPLIKGIVLFRKKDPSFINKNVRQGHNTLIGSVDQSLKREKFTELFNKIEAEKEEIKKKQVRKFKDSWFGGNDVNRPKE